MNHLWPVSSYSAPGPPPLTGRATVVLARTSVPPCFSVIPIPARAPAFSAAGALRRVVGGGEEARLPLGGQLGLRAQRRDHRVGHRDRAADPGLGLRHAHEGGAAGDVGAGPRVLPGRASAARGRPRRPSARARRGGTRPRRPGCRSGRGCAASAGSRWPAGPAPAPRRCRRARRPRRSAPRPSRRPRARTASTSTRVGLEDVVVDQRRRLVRDLVGCRRCGARPLPSARIVRMPGRSADARRQIASPPVAEDQGQEPDRRARRRRDDPDHLVVHQRAADPALPRRRARVLRPRDREPRRERRPDHGRRRRTRSSSTASASSARRSPPTRRGSRSSA